MKMSKALRPNRDTPQLETTYFGAVTAGTGTDFEHVIVSLPNLAQGAPSGSAQMTGQNAMTVRWVQFVFETTLTGANTNNFTLNINHKRAGAAPVNTTSATTITAGTIVVTPASMAGIRNNGRLVFSAGTGAAETVAVSSVNSSAGTFTATFVNGHSGAYTIVSAPIATTGAFASAVNSTALVPLQVAANQGNVLLPGDVLTFQRVSIGTGLAMPPVMVVIDWENYLFT